MGELMDVQELAAFLKIDRQTLYNWLRQGRLPGIKVGRVWRFERAAIEQWLRRQTLPAHAGGTS